MISLPTPPSLVVNWELIFYNPSFRVPWRQLVPLPAVPTKNQIQNPSSPTLNPAFPPPPIYTFLATTDTPSIPPENQIPNPKSQIPNPKSQILTHPPPKKPPEPHLRRL